MKTDERITDGEIQLNSGRKNWCRKIGQGVLLAYFVVMAAVYPYYAPGGYLMIGEVKYVFFRNVTLAALAVMAVVVVCSLVRRPGLITEYYRRMSVTDWFAYGYFMAVMLSYLCSPYKEEALGGAEGWHMGAMMQMTFVLLFFLFSRYFTCEGRWLAVWLTAAAGVFLLGILNRYSIYPIAMAGQTPVFISTLGNINWFCGYWSVTAPIGMTLYWCCEKRRHRAAAGFYSLAAVLAGAVQGSESACLVFAAVFAALLLFSIHNARQLCRWTELCMIFAAGCQLGRILRYLPGFQMNYQSTVNDGSPSVMERLTEGNGTLWALCIILLCYIVLRLRNKRAGMTDLQRTQNLPADRRSNRITAAIAAVCLCVGACGLIGAGDLLYDGKDAAISEQESNRVTVFNEDWGNGRGAAWNCSIEAYRDLDTLHRIVGVGPDCFAVHIYEDPAMAKRLMEEFGQERLTNAHNEGLSILLNMGALGLICYVGFVGSALARYCRKAGEQPLLYVCAVGLLAYTAHNVVSFQQVLNTPFFFILMGMGEGLLRGLKEKV